MVPEPDTEIKNQILPLRGAERVIYQKTLDFVSKNPKQKNDIERSLNIVKVQIEEHPNDDYHKKFEWDDVLVDYHKLKKWMLAGFLSMPYKSNKRKKFQFIDIDATEKAIEDHMEMEKAEKQVKMDKSINISDDIFRTIYGLNDIKDVIRMALKADKQVHVAL